MTSIKQYWKHQPVDVIITLAFICCLLGSAIASLAIIVWWMEFGYSGSLIESAPIGFFALWTVISCGISIRLIRGLARPNR